jgi:hypothetical protein
MNTTEVNGFTGLLGFGIREMDDNEFTFYCENMTNVITRVPLNENFVNFTHGAGYRAFTSGCYYYDSSTGYWTSNGVQVADGTSLSVTVCQSNHLTEFAGGFVVLPNAIDFNYVFAHASFATNPTLYACLIAISVAFVLLGLLSRYLDARDDEKLNLNLLPDNEPSQTYCYEIIVFTGKCSDFLGFIVIFFILFANCYVLQITKAVVFTQALILKSESFSEVTLIQLVYDSLPT